MVTKLKHADMFDVGDSFFSCKKRPLLLPGIKPTTFGYNDQCAKHYNIAAQYNAEDRD